MNEQLVSDVTADFSFITGEDWYVTDSPRGLVPVDSLRGLIAQLGAKRKPIRVRITGLELLDSDS